MLKKMFLLITVLALTVSLSACGGAANTVQEAPAPTAEASENEEPKAEEPVADEKTEVKEVVEEPVGTNEEPEGFSLSVEYATEKLQKLTDAYNDLFESKGEVEELTTRLLYDGSVEVITESDVQTKDGYSLQNVAVDYDRDVYTINGIAFGTLLDYYYNYVNNDTGYVSFNDYIADHNKDELADVYLKIMEQVENDGSFDTNDYFMFNVKWIPAIMSNDAEKVTVENVTDAPTVEHKSVIVSNLSTVDVAYQADIFIDGKDSGLKLVFDKDGNLLNINDESAQIEVVVPVK